MGNMEKIKYYTLNTLKRLPKQYGYRFEFDTCLWEIKEAPLGGDMCASCGFRGSLACMAADCEDLDNDFDAVFNVVEDE